MIRTPGGRVTVEPKSPGVEAVAAILRDALREVEADLTSSDPSAAA